MVTIVDRSDEGRMAVNEKDDGTHIVVHEDTEIGKRIDKVDDDVHWGFCVPCYRLVEDGFGMDDPKTETLLCDSCSGFTRYVFPHTSDKEVLLK